MYRLLCLLLQLTLCTQAMLAAYAVSDVPNVHLADSTRFTSNPAGVLSTQAVAAIDSTLQTLMRTTSAEAVVVALDSADSEDLDTYATELFTKWGLGKKDKDNGLLILISRDQRQAVIRTGQGLEGILPDALCARLIRNVMAPNFREGDYDAGTIAAVQAMAQVVTDPANRDEILSSYANNGGSGGEDDEMSLSEFLLGWLAVGGVLACAMLCVWLYTARKGRGQSAHKRFDDLHSLLLPTLVTGAIGLGVPLLLYPLIKGRMKRLRDKPRLCPSCASRMERLDEVHDNDYLTAPQDTEERIGSVDYDVWLCPKCGDTTVEPYVNHSTTYQPCELCHTRAARQVRDVVEQRPTTLHTGRGYKLYHCSHCRNDFKRSYVIPKVTPPPVVTGGSGRGGGGGFSGGSFGGGMTMGGGARGGW